MDKQYYQNPNENIIIHLEKKLERICYNLSITFRNYDSFDMETGISSMGNYKGKDELGRTSWFRRMLFINFAYFDDKLTESEIFVNCNFGTALVNVVSDYIKALHREEWFNNAFETGSEAVFRAHYELMDIPFVAEGILRYFAAMTKDVINDGLKNRSYEHIRAMFNDEVSPFLLITLSIRYNLNAKEVDSLFYFYAKSKSEKAEILERINTHKGFFGVDSESKCIKKIFRKINNYDKQIR